MDVSRYLQNVASSVQTKRYVLLLQRTRLVSEQETKLIEKASEHAIPKHILIRLDDPLEGLKVLQVKNVEIVILHHSLMDSIVDLVDLAKQLKERRKVTILFIVNDERALIDTYREKMSLYEELDDFVVSPIDPAEFFKKLQKIGTVEARAAKRFSVDTNVKLTRVETLQKIDAKLLDLSLVGCGFDLGPNVFTRRGEQMRIQIPLFNFGIFHPQYGDYLNLSLRVKRLSITGENVGCSIEYLTPMQSDCLVDLLEDVSRRQRMFKMTTREKRGAQLGEK